MLASLKILAGVFGNSYALIADGIESTADIVTSLVVWGGLRVAETPANERHPYGYGKAEALAGVVAALGILVAAVVIAVQAIREILTPHHLPHWSTLLILLLVVGVKETLARWTNRVGEQADSVALQADAWHHRADAISSIAAFIGIAIALVGGPGYEPADDWAALVACLVIGMTVITCIFTMRAILKWSARRCARSFEPTIPLSEPARALMLAEYPAALLFSDKGSNTANIEVTFIFERACPTRLDQCGCKTAGQGPGAGDCTLVAERNGKRW
jgi:predicted Co/Zn/Cd cation transporter (cation efflux family)